MRGVGAADFATTMGPATQAFNSLLLADSLLIVSDFDGTLAPVQRDPLGARIDPAARRALRRLSRLRARTPERLGVAILSGRGVGDLAPRVRVGGIDYLGNHGLEVAFLPPGGRPELLTGRVDDRLAMYAEPMRAIADAVARLLGWPDWLFVEWKGPTVAFHFRAAPDASAARRAIDDALAEARREAQQRFAPRELQAFDGRRVVELRPASAGGKAAAVERLVADRAPAAVLVLGDDRADAEAFRVVTARREAGSIAALSVGVDGGTETPAELLTEADVCVGSPADVAALLSTVADAWARRRSSAPRAARG